MVFLHVRRAVARHDDARIARFLQLSAAAARQSLDELISSTDDAAKETEEYKDEVARLQSEITKNEAAETKCAQAVANHTVKANDAQVKLNALNRELASNGKYLAAQDE